MTIILYGLSPIQECRAQNDDQEEAINLIYRSTLIGGGAYSIRDTYLSPFEYTGFGIRLLDERSRMTRLMKGNLSNQQIIHIDFSSTDNPAETASEYAFMLDYSYGGHYHFRPLPQLKLLAGVQSNLHLGAIYNTRNGNNPVSAKAGLHLNFSGIADYRLRIGKQPLSLRYQADLPFVGCLFSPHYGQSYYEISLGNHDGLINFSHFGNYFVMKNYLTAELPLKPFTLRLTYLNSYYQTNIHSLKTQIKSHTLMIGFVKEIFSVQPKHLLKNKNNTYRRVYD